MIQAPLENPVFVTRTEHDQLRQEMEEGFTKVEIKIDHLTEAMILSDDKIYAEMGRRFDLVDSRLGRLESDVGTLKSDVGTLKSDVNSLKSDMQLIKNHFGIVG